jgi:PIN domain nuclease of toxin-antitoxin system
MMLDTCALIFLATGDTRLSASARTLLSNEPVRWFCAISGFEVALKYQQRKLELPLAPARWLEQLAARYALTEMPLDAALCIAAAELPPHHRDPCDRFIIAAAKRLHTPIVTVDSKFEAYGVEVIR